MKKEKLEMIFGNSSFNFDFKPSKERKNIYSDCQ